MWYGLSMPFWSPWWTLSMRMKPARPSGAGARLRRSCRSSGGNTVLGNLETGVAGTYHALKFAKYAHRYLAEFRYRFTRRFDLRSILQRFGHAACTTKPHSLGQIRG
jgi:hypothetical protein